MSIRFWTGLKLVILLAAPTALACASDPQAAERSTVLQLAADAQSKGDSQRGAAVFASQKFACTSCHRVGDQGGKIGPDLSRIGTSLCPEEIAESLLWPKRKVKPEFAATAIVTDAGSLHQGYILRENADEIVLHEATSGEELTIRQADIAERQEVGSLMPEGLAASMTRQERSDVVRFLLDLKDGEGAKAGRLLAHIHRPQAFSYDFGPLMPAQWRFTRHPVNRDRLYDFYSKEADHFRLQDFSAAILPPYPGLDGGRYGHWGNQNEDTWRDDRWNSTDLGSLQCGIFLAGGKVIPRAVCLRLGDEDQLAVCFNPENMNYEHAWKGGFLKTSPVRHGFVDGLEPVGQPIECDAGTLPPGKPTYRGYYRHGRQTIFAYDLDGRRFLDAPGVQAGKITRIVAPENEHPLRHLTRGGPAQWPQIIETRGTLGRAENYVIDTIGLPTNNPWKALLFFGGHDFLPDGSAMLCTIQGDVWHVWGLDASLEHVRWKRFASGLHHPLGLVVADECVFVLGRNQITRLVDLNRDDEADFYECFSQAYVTSTAGHDFICGLERDSRGNFYTASGNQGLLRISANGRRADVLATGFRNPDGLGLAPDGSITVPCSEGEWTATSMICLVKPSDFEAADPNGNKHRAVAHFGYRGPEGTEPPRLPLVYLPRGLDNSAAGQTHIGSDRWGPLKGLEVHFSYGAGTYFLLLRDHVGKIDQGGVVPMPGDFASGAHRGRFHPLDGQLYVTGMAGWGTYTPDDGCFERVRYTGGAVQMPSGFHVYQNGIRVSFTSPVDRHIAEQAKLQFAQAWNYRYSAAYGSAEYAPSHPGMPGHDHLKIAASHALDDGRSIFLEIPDLQPVNQLHLRLRIDDGQPHDLFLTVHALDEPFSGVPGYRPVEKTIAAHPILADLAALNKPPVPNRWRKSIADARALSISAGKNLSFADRSITVRAGEPIKLTFINPDVVPHNWVLLKSGSLLRVGEMINRLVADPEAALHQYVPQSDDVLAYTDIVPAGESFHIFFRAPTVPGRYPYLCSFPGHWMVMNGQLIVE